MSMKNILRVTILIGLFVQFSCGYMNISKKSSYDKYYRGKDLNFNRTTELALNQGDTLAYFVMRNYNDLYISSEYFYISLIMANRYGYPYAYYDVYYCLTDLGHKKEFTELDGLDNKTRSLALEYLMKGAENNEEQCIYLLDFYLQKGMYLPQRTKIATHESIPRYKIKKGNLPKRKISFGNYNFFYSLPDSVYWHCKDLVLSKGDTSAYCTLYRSYIAKPYLGFLYLALIMANKYDYKVAYKDVYFCLTDIMHKRESNELDDLDIKTRSMALNYLIEGAEKGNKECIRLYTYFLSEGKYLPKDDKKAKELMQKLDKPD